MTKHNQDGAVSGVGVALVLCVVLLICALSFGFWAFASRQDYKDNSDQKVAAAAEVAKQKEGSAKEKEFTERDKSPVRTYSGPEAYGSLSVSYPKSWSGYVDDSGNAGNGAVDGYFYPGVVPSITNQNSTFALRVQVLNQSYSQSLKGFEGLQQSGDKKVAITAYSLPKLPKVVGVQLNGSLPNNKTGIMVVLPLRAQTLEIWTEGDKYVNDFNTYILPNFSFAP